MEEEWRDIPNFEGRYQVSNYGNVRSLLNSHGGKLAEPLIRKLSITQKGYYYLSVSNGDKHYALRVHKAVALAFIPNPNNLPCINHKDENKLNNRVDNLEWCTHKYNSNYGTNIQRTREKLLGRKFTLERRAKMSHTLLTQYELHPERRDKVSRSMSLYYSDKDNRQEITERNKRVHNRPVLCVETGQVFPSLQSAAKHIGVAYPNISSCCRHQHYTSGGFHWRYVNSERYTSNKVNDILSSAVNE